MVIGFGGNGSAGPLSGCAVVAMKNVEAVAGAAMVAALRGGGIGVAGSTEVTAEGIAGPEYARPRLGSGGERDAWEEGKMA